MIDTNIFKNRKAAYYTLGCKLNFSETSTIARYFEENNVYPVKKGETADIVVINTCSVTELADHKCRQIIRRYIKQHPGAFVVVVGCYAQLKPEAITGIPGVDLVLGAKEKMNILSYIDDFSKKQTAESHTSGFADITNFNYSCSKGDRTRYFLKVQDGCDYFCTYCTIPFARGRSRNGTIERLVEEARKVAAEGGKEIVLTGVNVGDFGKTTGDTFFDLVKALDNVDGIERYRISSIEPNLLTDEIIEYVANSSKFMPHFHVPLQAGSDEVLKLMRRRYDTALFRSKMETIKKFIPDAFIGVDVIVGARGETDELFEEAYRFIESLDISQLHVFPYSERPGTAALKINYVVNPQIRHERCRKLIELSDSKTADFYRKYEGSRAKVLLEHSKRGNVMNGFTENYIKVEVGADRSLDNHIVEVQLQKYDAETGVMHAVMI